MSEMVKEDSWPDVAWPDFLRRQHQLQPFSLLLDE